MGYEEHHEPLSTDERAQLRGGLRSIGVFTLFCIGLFTFILHLIVSHDGWSSPAVYVFGATATVFATVIGVQLKRALDDLDLDRAIVLRGFVAGKTEESRRSKSRSRAYYYLHFGPDNERRIEVDPGPYNRILEGDLVEIRLGPRSQKVFALQVLEQAAAPPPATRPATPLPPSEAPMTDADLKELRRCFFRRMRPRLLVIAFCVYFMGYFVWEGLWGIVLLFFPVPLLFFYSAFALGRVLWLYWADKKGGTKTTLALDLSDRSTARSRGKRHLLHFGGQRLEVEEGLFDRSTVGDRFTVYTGKRSGWLLGVEPTTRPSPD